MRMIIKIILNLFLFNLCNAKSVLIDDTPIVQTNYGPVRGFNEFDSFVYLGIPYASPPVNELRWKSPVDVKPWSPNTLNATQFQPACPQIHTCDPPGTCPPSVF